MEMPWLPYTVQHDSYPNPAWGPYYPPSVDMTENDGAFYTALENGVVTVYYYNCGRRLEQKWTSNPKFVTKGSGFFTKLWNLLDIKQIPEKDKVELVNFEDQRSQIHVTEDNLLAAGEAKFKVIVGWHFDSTSCYPDNKSEVAEKWRKEVLQ